MIVIKRPPEWGPYGTVHVHDRLQNRIVYNPRHVPAIRVCIAAKFKTTVCGCLFPDDCYNADECYEQAPER